MEDEVYDRLYANEDRHWWFRGRRRVIEALISRAGVFRAGEILDAGCGTGRNLVELLKLGRAHGVDASQRAVDYCHERGLERVTQSPLESLPFEPGTFDLILCADVIEHVDDDVAVLRELRRSAAPQSALVITTPAYNWMWSSHDERHHHRRRYTRPRLRAAAEKAGWSPEFMSHFNAVLLPPIAAVRLARRRAGSGGGDEDFGTGILNRALERPMLWEAAAIGRGVRLPFGVSIGAVLRARGSAP